MRRGVTLIEIIVALVLFQIAMLALTATTIVAARDLAAATLRTRALELAERRVARLRPGACGGAQSGFSGANGLREFWSVEPAGRVRVIRDSVELKLSRGTESLVVRAWVLCPA